MLHGSPLTAQLPHRLSSFSAPSAVSSYFEPPPPYGPSETTSATLLPDGTRVSRTGDWLMISPAFTVALFDEVKVEVRPTAASRDWASASGLPTTSGFLTRGPGAGGGGVGAALFTVTST